MKKHASTLAERLVLARRELGCGQDVVAKGAGISQQSYSDLERGSSKSTTKIGSLAHLLGVDAYWLETGNGDMRAIATSVGEERATYALHPDRKALYDWIDGLSDKQRKGLMQLLARE